MEAQSKQPSQPSRLVAVGLTFVALSVVGMLWVAARGGSFVWQVTVLIVGLLNVALAVVINRREQARQ